MENETSSRDPQVVREWQHSILVSVRFQQASFILLLIFATALARSALPLQLDEPSWYLTLSELISANAPIAITGACLGYFALTLNPLRGPKTIRWQHNLRKICAALSLLYFLVLPIQVFANSVVIFDLNSGRKKQDTAIINRQQDINSKIRKSTTINDLRQVLPRFPGNSSAVKLSNLKASMLDGLAMDAKNLRSKLRQEYQDRLANLLLNAIRVIIVSVPTALLFRMLSKRSEILLAGALQNDELE